MRYPASEKLEIIQLVEGSHLSARLTLAKLGIPRTTFYRWYDRYLQRGEAGLQDQSPKPKHVWNRIPDEVRRKVVKLALKETELSPRELAVTFTDKESYFVSEASTYRILKGHDLITSPAFNRNKEPMVRIDMELKLLQTLPIEEMKDRFLQVALENPTWWQRHASQGEIETMFADCNSIREVINAIGVLDPPGRERLGNKKVPIIDNR